MKKLLTFFSLRPLPRLAIGLWIGLYLMAARMSIFVRRRAYGDYTAVDRMALLEIILMFVALGLVVYSRRIAGVLAAGTRGGVFAYAAAIGFGVLSAVWSPLPTYSAYRALAMFSQFLAVLVVLSFENDFFAAEKRFLQAAVLVMVMQMVQLVGWTAILTAPFMRNNTLATSAAMIACYCLPEAWVVGVERQRKKQLLIIGVLAFFCVSLGVSSGSNVSLLAGLLVGLLLLRRSGLVVLLIAIAICLWFFAVPIETLQARIFPNKNEEQIATMSGRTMLWEMYMERVKDNLWIGEGYAATARVAEVYSTNTHNAFMSFLTGTGIVGTLLYVLGLVKGLGVGLRQSLRRQPGAVGLTAGMVAGLTNSMTKAFLGEGYYPETLIFFLLFGMAALHLGRYGSEQATAS